MKLGIMQPYFFPYLGYFELIYKVDKWLVFDIVQYNSKTWMNRNRILHPKTGWQYISAPVTKHHHATLLSQIEIKDMQNTLNNLLGKLTHYKKKAPYYNETINVVKNAFFSKNNSTLVDLNVNTLKSVCNYLGISFDYQLCSSLNFELPKIQHPGQWALEISKIVGAKEYINPSSGKKIFRQNEFDLQNIKLSFLDDLNFKYDSAPYDFVSGLSILDVLMWNSVETIGNYLSRHTKSD